MDEGPEEDVTDITMAIEELLGLVGRALDDRAIRQPHRKALTRSFVRLMRKLGRARDERD